MRGGGGRVHFIVAKGNSKKEMGQTIIRSLDKNLDVLFIFSGYHPGGDYKSKC